MVGIHGNAFLTIAAASARSVHEGIFHDRKIQGEQVVIKFSAENNGSLDNAVYIQHNPVFCDYIDEPLYHRGWTLQERMLSPRVVVFTRLELPNPEYDRERNRNECTGPTETPNLG